MNRKELMAIYRRLSSERQQYESIWQEAFEFASPENACITKQFNPAERLQSNLYATTARRALPFFIGIMQSAIMPANEQWHKLIPPTAELREDITVCSYYQKLTETLFEYRYKPQAGFNEAMISNWKSEGIVGHGVTMVNDAAGGGMFYENIPVQNFLFETDEHRNLKRAFWTHDMTGEDLTDYLIEAGKNPQEVLPVRIQSRIKDDPSVKIPVVYCVYRLKPFQAKSFSTVVIDAQTGKERIHIPRYETVLMLKDSEETDNGILLKKSSRTMPFMYSPYDKIVSSVFSSSPTISCLTDLRMKNRIRKSTITGAERSADPTLLAMKDSGLANTRMIAGQIIHGGMARTSDGHISPAIQPLNLTGDLRTAFEMENLVEEEIGEYFLKSLYFLFYGQTQPKTATEINQLAMERGKMMSILSCPVEKHLIYPMSERELDILYRQGRMPKGAPEKVEELFKSGEPFFAVEYEGEVKRAQLLKQAAGIMQTVEVTSSIAQFDPSVRFCLKWREMVESLAKTNDMPLNLIAKQEEYVKAVKEQEQQAIEIERIKAMGRAADPARIASQDYNMQSYGV